MRTEEFNEGLEELITDGLNRESIKNRIALLSSLIMDLCIKDGYVWVGDQKGHFAMKEHGYYNPKVYQRLSLLISKYFDEADEFVKERDINEVRLGLKRNRTILTSAFENNKKYVNFLNGVVPLWGDKAWTLQPHPDDLMTLIQIPWNYVDDAFCPKWDKFMWTVAKGTDDPSLTYQTLWEIMGYCMQFSVKMKKAFFLISKESNTGKSTFLNVLTALTGENNVSKIRLDKLTNLGFGSGGAAHKLLNYFDDLPRYIKVDTLDIWKSQIDGKSFDYEKKYEDSTKHPNILKQIYAANGLPSIAWDLTITVRLIIIVFKHIFEDIIPHWEFKEIISSQDEMEGIVRRAMTGLKDLFDRGYFRAPNDEDLLHTLRLETDIIYQFIHKCCNLGFKDREAKDLSHRQYINRKPVLFARFQQYQELTGNTSDINSKIFTKALKRMGYTLKQYQIKEKSEMNRLFEAEEHVVVYVGIQFNEYPKEFIVEEVEVEE